MKLYAECSEEARGEPGMRGCRNGARQTLLKDGISGQMRLVFSRIALESAVPRKLVREGKGSSLALRQLLPGDGGKLRFRMGAFWEARYHATAVDTRDYLARCLVYIDLNMVHAGVVAHLQQCCHGDYREIPIPP